MPAQNKYIQLSENFQELAELFAEDFFLFLKNRGIKASPVQILVPNKETENWLKPFLTKRFGVLANVRFLLPFEWLWKQIRSVHPDLPELLPSERGPMLLSAYKWLLQGINQLELSKNEASEKPINGENHQPPFFEPLLNLPESARNRAIFGLASQIASTFDGYQNYRPEMLNDWAFGGNPQDLQHQWQSVLWREWIREWKYLYSAPSDRATLFAEAMDYFSESDSKSGAGTSQKSSPADGSDHLFLFHAGLLPQPFLSLIEKRSFSEGAYLYSLIRAEDTLFSDRFALESKAILESIRQLYSFGTFKRTISSKRKLAEESINDTLASLHQLQVAATPIADRGTLDDTIEIHSCHTELREIEVLHQAIYSWLSSNPSLRPSDILVMTPDIEAFIPFISAVFDQKDEAVPQIPYWIPTRHQTGQSIVEAFLAMVSLLTGRFEPELVLEVLRYPIWMNRYDLTPQDLERISSWITVNRVLWGLHAEQKKELDQPADSQFTWNQFFTRAWNSMLWGEEFQNPHTGTSFSLFDSEDKRLILSLERFIDFLDKARISISSTKKTVGDWIKLVYEWADELLSSDVLLEEKSSAEALQAYLFSLNQMIEKSDTKSLEMPFDVFFSILNQFKKEGSGGTARFGQGVVFSNMVPLRGIPAKVICLIGISESRFPRRETAPDFDIMHQQPRFTERDRKREDRQLFYESLMAAQDKFYMSYTGQNPKDNSRIEPSPILVEFMDLLKQVFPECSTKNLLVEHSLNGFSNRYFDSESPLYGKVYLQRLVDIAKSNAESRDQAIKAGALRKLSSEEISSEHSNKESDYFTSIDFNVQRFITFFKNPIRSYLQHQYDIQIELLLDQMREFDHDPLTRHKVRKYILDERFYKKKTPKELYKSLLHASLLPSGISGELIFSELFDQVEQITDEMALLTYSEADSIDEKRAVFLESIQKEEISIFTKINGVHFEGALRFYRAKERRFYCSLSKSYGKNLIEFWLVHLFTSLQDSTPIEFVTVKKDAIETLRFHSLPKEKIEEILIQLVEEYKRGHEKPLRFFANSAAEWIQKCNSDYAFDPNELKEWNSTDYTGKNQRGDAHDAYVALLFGQSSSLHPEDDYPIFERIMKPLWGALEDSK